MSDNDRLKEAVDELAHAIWASHGFYLDARVALLVSNKEVRRKVPPETDLEEVPMMFGAGPRGSPVRHGTTVAEYLRRTDDGGRDHALLGQWFVVLIFGLWESRHRKRLALALELEKETDLTAHIFGDLRHLRHAVVHDGGAVTTKTERVMKVLTFIKNSDQLTLSHEHVDQIVDEISLLPTPSIRWKVKPRTRQDYVQRPALALIRVGSVQPSAPGVVADDRVLDPPALPRPAGDTGVDTGLR